MGFEIAPGDAPEDWTFDGEDWVKQDEDGVPWIWDGDEYGIKDSETGFAMVERDDGIYLKDASGKLIAVEDPKTGDWQYLDAAQPRTADSGAKIAELSESAPAPPAPVPASAPPTRGEAKVAAAQHREPAAAPAVPPPAPAPASAPPPEMEAYMRRFWCRDDNSVEVRALRRAPQNIKYSVAVVEHLRQIQYICKRILRANYRRGGVISSADQVLCAIAVTILDLFDPASAEVGPAEDEVEETQRALKRSLQKLLGPDDLQIFEPMRTRAMCLLKNRLQCCLQQLEHLSQTVPRTSADLCINTLSKSMGNILRRITSLLQT